MDHHKQTLLSSAYFGPVQYFGKLVSLNQVIIEQYDNYTKQTFRNRCVIASANGPIILSVPIKRNKGSKTLMKDILVDYDTNWQRLHHLGIISSYRSAPYFEFYFDEVEKLILRKYKYLIELNLASTELILQQLNLTCKPELSASYKIEKDSTLDFRESINPKKPFELDTDFKPIEYSQVFSDKFKFIPNMSIIDLIFNQGPNSSAILRKSIKT